MSKPKVLSAKVAQQIFGLGGDTPGLFELALGFHSGTHSIKSVHIMNDLAQCVLGGAPAHGGDLLCRIVREDEDDGANTDESIRGDRRFGQEYSRAFPTQLGRRRISQIRTAAGALLNVDTGMYKPGDNMASSVATHRDLLGFEGFRRFRVGGYLAAILEEDGRRRVRELYLDARDPVSRALLPLFVEEALVDKQHGSRPIDLTPFDRSLGRGLLTLLQQPLSKPTLLRYLALGSVLGIVLKVLGVGRPHGRPILLALPGEQQEDGPRRLREQAVLSFKLGVSELDRLLAEMLPRHPLAEALWRTPPPKGDPTVEVPTGRDLAVAATSIVSAMRAHRASKGETDLYWPDEFAVALGKKAGCVHPKHGGFGWGRHLALNAELMEVLVLMFVAAGQRLEWHTLWSKVRDHLGIVIGADTYADANALEDARVLHVSLEDLAASSEIFLRQLVRRGVARKLPDSGAEAGGALL